MIFFFSFAFVLADDSIIFFYMCGTKAGGQVLATLNLFRSVNSNYVTNSIERRTEQRVKKHHCTMAKDIGNASTHRNSCEHRARARMKGI